MRFLLMLAALAALPLTIMSTTQAAPIRVNWATIVAATPQGGVRMGNPNAAIKLVEYGSRTCPHCAKFDAEGLPALKAGPIASGKLSYEFRDFPVHGPLDFAPILLGRCVPVAKFFPVLDAMFADQPSLLAGAESVVIPPKATPNQIATAYGTKLGYVAFMNARFGVPAAQAKACLANRAGIDRIVATTRAARTLVQGTPTFIINGKVAEGAYDWATLEPLLRAAGM